MFLDFAQSFLLLTLYSILFNNNVSHLGDEDFLAQFLQFFPVKYKDIAAYPILSINLVYFLKRALDCLRLCCVSISKINIYHFFQFLSFKNSIHPFFFMWIKQYSLPIEQIIFEFPYVQIAIRKISFSKILKSISQVKATLNAFHFERKGKVIIGILTNFHFECHPFQMLAIINIANRYFSSLFYNLDAIV